MSRVPRRHLTGNTEGVCGGIFHTQGSATLGLMVNRFVLTLNTCGCVAVLLILVGALSMSGYNNGYEGAGGLPPGEEDVRGAGDSSCAEIRKLAALHPRMALPPRCRVLGQGQGMRDGFRTNVVVSQMPGMVSRALAYL